MSKKGSVVRVEIKEMLQRMKLNANKETLWEIFVEQEREVGALKIWTDPPAIYNVYEFACGITQHRFDDWCHMRNKIIYDAMCTLRKIDDHEFFVGVCMALCPLGLSSYVLMWIIQETRWFPKAQPLVLLRVIDSVYASRKKILRTRELWKIMCK
jgi:hypothetical protein